MAADPKSFFLSPEIHQYLLDHGEPLDDVQRWLIDETRAKVPDLSVMQIAPEQGTFMSLLTRVIGATRAVEVGTFTGYSSLCIARALSAGGRLLCCDVSEEWTAIAREAWKRAGVDDRIELVIAPAVETLRALPEDESCCRCRCWLLVHQAAPRRCRSPSSRTTCVARWTRRTSCIAVCQR